MHYAYDAADRLSEVRYEVLQKDQPVVAETVRYTYDDHGQVRTVGLVRAGQKPPYVVELFRDLSGRLVEARIDGHPP